MLFRGHGPLSPCHSLLPPSVFEGLGSLEGRVAWPRGQVQTPAPVRPCHSLPPSSCSGLPTWFLTVPWGITGEASSEPELSPYQGSHVPKASLESRKCGDTGTKQNPANTFSVVGFFSILFNWFISMTCIMSTTEGLCHSLQIFQEQWIWGENFSFVLFRGDGVSSTLLASHPPLSHPPNLLPTSQEVPCKAG